MLILFSVNQAGFAQGKPQAKPKPAAPDALQQHYAAARTYGISGDQERASAEYRAFLAEALRRVGNAETRAGDYKAAAEFFTEALLFAPKDVGLAVDRSASYLAQGQLDQAKTAAQQALDLAPTNSRAQYTLGRVLFQQGDYAGARKYLEKAVVTAPNIETGYTLGVTYLKLKDLEHAHLLFEEMTAGLGDTVDIRLLFGRAYRDAEYWGQAIDEFKKAIAKHPKVAQAHYFLGLAYLGRDNDSGIPEAIPEFRAELQVNPNDFRTRYMLGYCLLKQHDFDGAERELTRAAALEPQNPDPLVYLAQLYAEAGRKQDAERAARMAIEITKDEARSNFQISGTHYLLARVLIENGRREEGTKELQISENLRKRRIQRQVAQQNGGDTAEVAASQTGQTDTAPAAGSSEAVSAEAKAQAEAYIDQLKPAVADAYNNLGVAAAAQKDFAAAVTYFEKAASWNPSLEKADRNLGMAAFYGSISEKAVPPLERELSKHPDDTRVRAALGLSYFALENYGKTLQTLEPIRADVESDPGLSAAVAVSLVKTGRYDQGMTLLKALEASSPNSADIHVFMGNSYADQGIYATAIEEYRKAISLDSEQQRAHFLLGLALIRQGSPADAIGELRTALKLNPADVAAKYHLAFALLQAGQSGQKDEAVTLLGQVIEQDKNYADAYYQLGKLQLDQGSTKEAIPNLETASKLSPASDYMHYQLAMAYRRAARSEDAEREMKQYETLKSQRRGSHEPAQPN